MVDSMVLQSIGRTGSRAPPGLAIHSNSRGGGAQIDVFTKVPNASKTIAFRVESEETLIQAYRQVKAMNPSASVGGMMFSVAPKPESPFTEIDNVRWGSLTGRRSFASRFTPASRVFRSKFYIFLFLFKLSVPKDRQMENHGLLVLEDLCTLLFARA
jgi:hypothetical protein